MSAIAEKTRKTTKKVPTKIIVVKGLNGSVKRKTTSKKEESLYDLLKEVQEIAKKHNVKPFNRKEIYGNL